MKIIYRSTLEHTDRKGEIILRGFATTSTPDMENVSIRVRPESLDHLRRFGRLTYEHTGLPVGDILTADLKEEEKRIGVYLEGKLYESGPDAPEEVRRAHYMARLSRENRMKPLGFSIEGKPIFRKKGRNEKGEPVNEILVNLLPLVAVSTVPYNPETAVEVVERGFVVADRDWKEDERVLEVWTESGGITIHRSIPSDEPDEPEYNEKYNVFFKCPHCSGMNLIYARCDNCGEKFITRKEK